MQDELKDLWQSANAKNDISSEQLDQIISNKSTNLIEKLTKTVRFEHYFNILVSPIIVGLFIFESQFRLALILGLMLLSIITYYHFLLKKLRNHKIELNVHDYLVNSYRAFKSFINHYYIACFFIIGVSLYAGFELGLGLLTDDNQPEIFNESEDLYFLLFTVIITISITYLFIYLLYGRKIMRLKKIIEELEA